MNRPLNRYELIVLAGVPLAAAASSLLSGWADGWAVVIDRLDGWQPGPLPMAALALLLTLGGVALGRAIRKVRDDKARAAAEAELRQSEARFRAIYDNAGAGILLATPEGSILGANGAFQRMLGYDEETLRRKGWQGLLDPSEAVACPPATDGGGAERCFLHRDGHRVRIRLTTSYAFDDSGRPTLGIAVAEDVTLRRSAEADLRRARDDLERRVEERTEALAAETAGRTRAEEAAREAQRKFRALIENALDFVTVLDEAAVIRFQSPSIQAVLGYKAADLIGRSCLDFIHPEDALRVREAFESGIQAPGITVSLQFRARSADGTWRVLEATARNLLHDPAVGGVVVNGRDVTIRHRAERNARLLQDELSRAARLSTMGEMAAGFAHEINQPLTAIQNYTRGCVRRLKAGAPASEDMCRALESAAIQAQRASDIIRRLRWFIRRDTPHFAPFDVDAALREAIGLVENEARYAGVRLETALDEALPWVWGDATLVQQVLITLMRECLVAPTSGNRRRTLAVRTAAMEDGGVEITIAETGADISACVQAPPSAPAGDIGEQDVGMGLTACRSIVERHGGRLTVEDDSPRRGAFRITLRACEPTPSDPRPPAGTGGAPAVVRAEDPLN